MLGRAPLRACHHGRSRLLPANAFSVAILVLKNAQLARSKFARSYSSEHAHHEARIESVRNIGIIAHVDAVSQIFHADKQFHH